LPVVIYVHGGPEGHSRPIFNPVIQYFVAHGFGGLAPNVRGSTGYGYQYQSLDDVRLRMDSVADLQQAVLWLCESGIADAQQIAPIRHVDRIVAPLFVVHGANDPRVPVGEAEQIVAALRSRDVPVEYMRFEDEGHGLIKRANRLVAYPAIARFLDAYLGQE